MVWNGIGEIHNANGTFIKKNDVITDILKKEYDFNNTSEIENISIKYSISTEALSYYNPDDPYFSKYIKTIEDPILIENPQYGKTYYIIISGDKENGYKAELEKIEE